MFRRARERHAERLARLQALGPPDIVGESAKVAFFLLLALFPFIVALLSLTAYIGGEAAYRAVIDTVHLVVPPEAAPVIDQSLREIFGEDRPGFFSAALVFSLWAVAVAIFRIEDALQTIHRTVPRRMLAVRFIRVLGVTLLAAVTYLLGLVLVLAEPPLARDPMLAPIWAIVRWPLPLVSLGVVLGVIYFFLPERGEQASKRASFAGGVIAALLWVVATAGLRFYVLNIGEFGPVYGPVSAVIVVMLWVYMKAMSVLVGSHLVAVMERRMLA